MELPPRARRIPHDPRKLRAGVGTTSACAENTHKHITPEEKIRNYLRVRGEYSAEKFSIGCSRELPPRARRIPHDPRKLRAGVGTTSACAENTHKHITPEEKIRNYLRVRGEYSAEKFSIGCSRELPPRARRILFVMCWWLAASGTTSACAENTHHQQNLTH